MNPQARSLISILSTKSRLQSLVPSLLRRYSAFSSRSDFPGSSETPKVDYRTTSDETTIKVEDDIRSFGDTARKNSENVFQPDYSTFRRLIQQRDQRGEESGRNLRTMDFVRGVIEEDGRGFMNIPQSRRYNVEKDVDFVHIKLLRNNTFVTVTDSKGNKKTGASAGCLSEMKGGPKISRYAAEATAEHVGRLSRNLGLKSIVMKVKGFAFFKKKRQAIMSWKEGFSGSHGDQSHRQSQSQIVYIEDTTRRAHNGCRLPRKRRV